MIPEIMPYNNYTGDGVTTQFDFDFFIENGSQLVVQHTASDGMITTLTQDTDYSIHEVGNNNGSYITFPLPASSYSILASDEAISLQLTLPIEQQSEYGTSSELDLEALEYSLDYLTRIAQIQSRQLERAIKVQEASDIDTDELAVDLTIIANNIEAVSNVSADITNIDAVNENKNNIDICANSIVNVNNTGKYIGNVNTAATNINNINTVAGVSGNVTTVADKITNVNTVATNIQAVDNCSDNMDAIKEAPDYAQFAADCLASCQSIKGQFSLVSFLSGGSSANILQEDIYDGGSSSVLSENVYSGGNSEYKNVLTYDDIKNVHEITALQALVKTLVDRIEALENIKTISGGVAVA